LVDYLLLHIVYCYLMESFTLQKRIQHYDTIANSDNRIGFFWTIDEDNQLINAHRRHLSLADMAKVHRRSITAIRSRLLLLSHVDKLAAKDITLSFRKLCKVASIHPGTVISELYDSGIYDETSSTRFPPNFFSQILEVISLASSKYNISSDTLVDTLLSKHHQSVLRKSTLRSYTSKLSANERRYVHKFSELDMTLSTRGQKIFDNLTWAREQALILHFETLEQSSMVDG